jgi:hypothetical protein
VSAAAVIVLVVWVALFAASLAFFVPNRDGERKRRWFPVFSIAAAALFLVFIALVEGAETAAVALPLVALVTLVGIRGTRFCPGCGRTVFAQTLQPRDACPGCGRDLRPSAGQKEAA